MGGFSGEMMIRWSADVAFLDQSERRIFAGSLTLVNLKGGVAHGLS